MYRFLINITAFGLIGISGWLYGADMVPAVMDKSGILHKNQTYISNGRDIIEFGLYRTDNREFPTKMRVRLSQPCFIIERSEWDKYKKIDEFTVELIKSHNDYMAGFSGTTEHSPLVYNDDLPKDPVYILGVKGCEEAPNAMTITAYQKIDNEWKYKGEAMFIIKK